MKKQIFVVVGIILILGIILFWKIKTGNLNYNFKSDISKNALNRVFTDSLKSVKWFPKEATKISANEYLLNDCKIKILKEIGDYITVTINYRSFSFKSNLQTQQDSGFSISSLEFPISSKSYFDNISNYNNYRHIDKTLKLMLSSFQSFILKTENVYGFKFKKELVSDSTLISLRGISKNYPTVNEIYETIFKLESFSKKFGASQTNPPMLNIYNTGGDGYEYMLALPINKFININAFDKQITPKRMLVGGNLIVSDTIIGDRKRIDIALKEIEFFKKDNNLLSPAIPYESIITNRLTQKDSSKWETKLYYPIF